MMIGGAIVTPGQFERMSPIMRINNSEEEDARTLNHFLVDPSGTARRAVCSLKEERLIALSPNPSGRKRAGCRKSLSHQSVGYIYRTESTARSCHPNRR
jgi:hypothetical protein